MNMSFRLPASILLLTAPLAAHAELPSTGVDALIGGAVGGAIGGAIGAGLICWFCRRRGSKNDNGNGRDDPKRY